MPDTQTFPNQQTLPDQALGHYRILREAGRGGMSVVYEAEDTRIGRRVALKVLSAPLSLAPEQRAAMIARLKREARAIARLSHPNIVTIFDIGEDDGEHFIVMEFLEGLTLRERIAEGLMPLGEVAAVLDGAAAGLDAVHAAGIIHRDIKPSNVMLLPSGAVKLMDFGVARQYEDTLVTQAGSIVGSPTYMAPEQTLGEDGSAASDLWALGVTLYEMLAGRPPFAGENVPRILYQVAHERPPALPQASPAVRDVLNRALEKKPERRFRSARQLADAFRAALPALPAVRPAAPRPAPRLPVVPRPARARQAPGRRAALWAAGLLLLALLGLLFRLRPHPAPPPLAALPNVAHPWAGPPRGHARPVAALARTGAARTGIAHTGIAPPVAPGPAPVVRVAAWRQTRASHPRAVRHRRRVTRLLAAAPVRDAADMPSVRPARRLTRPRHSALARPRHTVPAPGHAEGAIPATARASSPPSAVPDGPRLTGTWHGTLTNHRATLVISRHEGNEFAGTMSVHTGGRDARVAVTGHVSREGRISMRETHRLPGTAADAWDLGTEAGRVGGDGRLSGTGTDTRGRAGGWSFSR